MSAYSSNDSEAVKCLNNISQVSLLSHISLLIEDSQSTHDCSRWKSLIGSLAGSLAGSLDGSLAGSLDGSLAGCLDGSLAAES